jgi:hypothetical protein
MSATNTSNFNRSTPIVPVASLPTVTVAKVGGVGVTPTPRQIRFDDAPVYFGGQEESEEEQENVTELMSSFKTSSVSASESQYMFGTTTYECVLPYEIIVWSEPIMKNDDFRDRISFNMWLLSMAEVDENTVVARVTDDLQHLEIYMKLPSILDVQRVDERNARL